MSSLPYPFLRNCARLIAEYSGEVPFHVYLKQEFKKNPSWGSKDRKNYRQHCYRFWRHATLEQKSSESSIMQWIDSTHPTAENNKSSVNAKVPISEVLHSEVPLSEFWKGFPKLSVELSVENRWNQWYSAEAPVWIKIIRPQSRKTVLDFLRTRAIPLIAENPQLGALCIPGLSPIHELEQQGHILIQDIGSQSSMVLDGIIPVPILNNENGMSMVWDACCGAGGKALSLAIYYPNLDIQCSDIRTAILENLNHRFDACGAKKPFAFKHNLAESRHKKTSFKIVIADIPCSGSGTWRRNPEEKWFYDEQRWEDAQNMQLSMVKNAALSVSEEGYLVVCTCSVFARENEGLIEKLMLELNSQTPNWEILSNGFMGGMDANGDYIYRTVLRRNA